jgi:exodeoxyribonuclease VII small subunit
LSKSERSDPKSGPAAAADPGPGSEPYDRLVCRLEKVVEQLEGGGLTLEQSIEKFAEGIRMVREASKRLEEAERKVETLLRAEDGSVDSTPLSDEGTGDGR